MGIKAIPKRTNSVTRTRRRMLALAAGSVALVPLMLAGSSEAVYAAPLRSTVVPHDSGCNRWVCIFSSGTGEDWNVAGQYNAADDDNFYGHIEIVLSGGNLWANGPDEWYPYWSAAGMGNQEVCVIGWQKNQDGSYTNVGEPCVYF